MSRRLLFGVVGLVLFVAFLITAMPARFIFDMALKPVGVQAGQVQGRVWDAQLLRVQARDIFIAEARAQLDPASLLGFSPSFDTILSDPGLRGSGRLTLSSGGVRVDDARGVVRLERIAPELAFIDPDGIIQLDVDALGLDADGRCQTAQGQATTAALRTLGDGYGIALPMLRFNLLCAGEDVAFDLSGDSDVLVISGRLRAGTGGLEGRVEASTSDTRVITALSFAGFEQLDQTTYELTLPRPGG